MAQYRTVTAVNYVKDGKVVSVDADRFIELSQSQAEKLAGKVELVETQDSFLPGGSPIIDHVIVRNQPVVAFSPVTAPAPAPAKPKSK